MSFRQPLGKKVLNLRATRILIRGYEKRSSSLKPFLVRMLDDTRINYNVIEKAHKELMSMSKDMVCEYVLGEIRDVDDYDTMLLEYVGFTNY